MLQPGVSGSKKNTRLRIAVYSGIIPATPFIENLINVLIQNGHHVLLFGRKRGQYQSACNGRSMYYVPDNRIKVTLFAFFYWLRLAARRPREIHKVYNAIRQGKGGLPSFFKGSVKIIPVILSKPDVFHIQWAKALPAWMFLKNFGVKIALSLRGTHINYSPVTVPGLAEVYRVLFPHVDGFHAVSHTIANVAANYGAKPEKTRIVYSYVKDKLIVRGRQKLNDQACWVAGRPLSVVSIGRHHWIKGYTYAIDAMRILIDRGCEVRYSIVASGDPEECIFHIHDLGLTRVVTINDAAAHERVVEYIASADVLLLPSVEEGIANVVLEAMALGTVVVTTDCGGMREVVQDNSTGFIVPKRNSLAIADALEKISKLSPPDRRQIAEDAHNTISECHTRSAFESGIEQFYQLVVGGVKENS